MNRLLRRRPPPAPRARAGDNVVDSAAAPAPPRGIPPPVPTRKQPPPLPLLSAYAAAAPSATALTTAAATAVAAGSTKHHPISSSDSSSATTTLNVVLAVSFLTFLSTSLVALSPAPALMRMLPDAKSAPLLLSALSASAALVELAASRSVGRLVDATGRKPALTAVVATLAAAHAAAALVPSVAAIAAQKLVGGVAGAFFFLTTQTIFGDLGAAVAAAAAQQEQQPHGNGSGGAFVSVAVGRQMALTGVSFLLGVVAAGQLAEQGLSVVYGVSAGIAAAAVVLIQFGLAETLVAAVAAPPSSSITAAAAAATKKVEKKQRPFLLQSPLSCTRLLTRHGQEVRVLGVLLMLMTLPMYLGDFFQIYARQEWQLSTRDFSNFLALFGVVGIAANAAGGYLVRTIGVKKFTAVAIVSKLLSFVGIAFFGYRGSVIGLVVGFLGAAQTLGVVAALIAAGAQSGRPQGEMAGERAALLALLKVFGPVLYSTLYVQGQKWGNTSNLPFLFNIGLSVAALVISQRHL